jgi:hypothetical protein
MGDTIQFIRYIPRVKAGGGTVILEVVKPMLNILKGFPGIDELVERVPYGNLKIDFDYSISLLSLPKIFNTRMSSIPKPVRGRNFFGENALEWKNFFSNESCFKIGIVWAGNPVHPNDRNRSVSLKRFYSLAAIPEVRLYGLQVGEAALEIDEDRISSPVVNLGHQLKDLTDTVAAIEYMDLIITVDTLMAHLSGTIGKPTWVLLPYNPDWRWLLDRADSPWYPSIRLFRQQKIGDWDSVFRNVVNEIRTHIAHPSENRK